MPGSCIGPSSRCTTLPPSDATERCHDVCLPAVQAGALYFVLVFAAGFVLGTLRVAFVAPALGAVTAVALELPLILAIAWLTARTITARLAIALSAVPRLVMGGSAFALLVTAEYAGPVALMGMTGAEYLAKMTTAAGLIGLTGQILFALVPLAQMLCRHRNAQAG